MKTFSAAVSTVTDEAQAKIDARVEALMSDGLSRPEAEAREQSERPEKFVEFQIEFGTGEKKVTKTYKSYPPLDGQLAFLMANMGRGNSGTSRFAAIVNIMLETMRGEDRDDLEARLMTGDRSKAVPMPVLEGLFEYLSEEWFRDESSESGSSV